MNNLKGVFAPTPTVGAFNTDNNAEFTNTLAQLQESFASENQIDSITDIKTIIKNDMLMESYKDTLLGDYHAYEAPNEFANTMHQLNVAKLEQLVENSKEALLAEASSSTLNPVVGLTLPLLKKNWIENVMKDYLQTEVTPTPVINRQIERLFIKDSQGTKHYIPDIFEDGGDAVAAAMASTDRPLSNAEITVPIMNYDLMEKSGGSIRQRDAISRNFRVSQVQITDSANADQWMNVNIKPNVATNSFAETIVYKEKDKADVVDMISGMLDFETGKLTISCAAGKIKKVKVAGTLSSENNMKSSSVDWETTNKQFIISDGRHFNTGLTEEKLKDESVLYKIDGAAKAVTNMSLALNQFKDFDQYNHLLKSKEEIKDCPKVFLQTTFDCKPQGQYAHTPTEYRAIELKETLDNVAIELRKVLRTPDCFFAVIGNPRDVKLLGDISWNYTASSDIVGGCKLRYSYGLMNGDHKFLVLSSDKIQQGILRVIVRPTTEQFISYIHYDYSFMISNNYRDPNMPNVPSVMCSDRYLTDDITPIQGEIHILNNFISSTEMWKGEGGKKQ